MYRAKNFEKISKNTKKTSKNSKKFRKNSKKPAKKLIFETAANHTNPHNYRRREWSSASLQLSLPLVTSPYTPLPLLVEEGPVP